MRFQGVAPVGMQLGIPIECEPLAPGSPALALPVGVSVRSTPNLTFTPAQMQALGVTPITVITGVPGAIAVMWRAYLLAQFAVFGTGVAPQIRLRYAGTSGAQPLLSTLEGGASGPNTLHASTASLSGAILPVNLANPLGNPPLNPPVGADVEIFGANMTGGNDATFNLRIWYFLVRVF